MMESLRILFSAIFLSVIFLGAYYFINTPSNDHDSSLPPFLSDTVLDEESTAPVVTDSNNAEEVPTIIPAPNTVAENQTYADSPNTTVDPLGTETQELTPVTVPNTDAMPMSNPAQMASASTTSQQALPTLPTLSSEEQVSVQEPLPIQGQSAVVDSTSVPGPLMPDTVPSSNTIAVSAPVNAPVANLVSNNADRVAVATFLQEAQQRIERGEILPTLVKLSGYYNAPQLTPEEAKAIHVLLMKLAGEVVYLHPEKYFNLYIVQPGDTISSIAQKHQVPWQFLAKINGLSSPYRVQPGEKVKVVRGPFNAEVHLDSFELTLWLPVNESMAIYAGTFPIGVGADCPQLKGDYIIDEKFINPEYPKFSNNAASFMPGDPNNPYGTRLLSLTCVNDPNHVKIGLHGTNNPQYIHHSVPYGFICLGSRDINDLYDILSVGSRIRIE